MFEANERQWSSMQLASLRISEALSIEAQLKSSMQPFLDMQAQWKSSMQPLFKSLLTQAKLQADIKPNFDHISNVLSAMQPVLDMEAQLKSSMQPLFKSLSTQAKLQADIKPNFDHISNVLSAMNGWRAPVRRVKQIPNEDEESRSIPIRVEGVDYVLRVSCSIRILDEDVEFER